MDRLEKLARLKTMLSQIAPDGTLESMPAPRVAMPPVAADLGGPAAPSADDREVEAAAAALQKLRDGLESDIGQPEIERLEAIVLPENRPVALIRGGKYEALSAPWTHLNADGVRRLLAPAVKSIGRIDLPTSIQLPFGGSGFVVGPDLLMTNRHVARLFAEGVGLTGLVYQEGDAAVDFKREVNSRSNDRSAYFEVRGVDLIHPYWDMALLRVTGLGDRFPALTLSILEPGAAIGRDVVAIGYPARDSRNDLALQDRIFARIYDVKRLQPGKLRDRARIRSFDNIVNSVTHDSSTLGGNSGSAVVDVTTGHVVGLHFGGEYLKANYAVPAYELARDARVVDRGVNFAGHVPPTALWDDAWRKARALEKGTVPGGPTVVSVGGGAMTWTIPLHVTVTVGQPAPADGSDTGLPSIRETMQVPVIFDGLEQRTGYRRNFLGLAGGKLVPLPTLTTLGKSVVARLQGGSAELKYHRFSVFVHKGRRMAIFTASNVDWRPAMRLIGGKKPTRQELTGLADGVIEQWVTDTRISDDHQLPDLFFTKDGGAFDKGHLVRRDDVAWGSTFEDMQKSNGDTYHTTNCSPQVMGFNQSSRGLDNWGDLENLVQKQTDAEKAIVFSGPVLAPDDRLFVGRDLQGTLKVRIPRQFWKIVVVKGGSSPEAYGFVLKQDLAAVPLVDEFAVPANWKTHMTSVKDIEALTFGLVKLTWLKAHDKFDSNEGVNIRRHLH